MILIGESLGARQKHLNILVNEAASNKVPFVKVEEKKEENDVDKLFKIDLAGKYKNVEYIVEVLKCGDSLYISRALKCTFLYDDEFANIINPEYLHNNVFPSMSQKMKKKLLSTIAMNIRNEERAKAFYEYCINANLLNFARQFLIFTSDVFKTDVLENHSETFLSVIKEDEDIKFFIGNNITLANLYLKIPYVPRGYTLYLLRHFYSIDADLYLNWVEAKAEENNVHLKPVGSRISKDIVKNHKDRFLKHIHLYIELVNKKTLVKYTTAEKAKLYLIALLPENVEIFWTIDFCRKYDFLLELILLEERYNFLKSIFSVKYPNQLFEMSSNFNTLKYYNFMTTEQRESWALCILAKQVEPDYEYYRFINYDKAVVEIKKLIYITPDADKRSEMINVLVESARDQQSLENLLKYYYERHINESKSNKETFLNKVLRIHYVFGFGESCWTAFDKLLHSLDIYSHGRSFYYQIRIYLEISLIYYIINNKELTEGLKKFAFSGVCIGSIKQNIYKLNEEKQDVMCRYLQHIQVDKLKELKDKLNEDSTKDRARAIISSYDEIKAMRKLQEDEPEIVTTIRLVVNPDSSNEDMNLHEANLLKFLKQDVSLVTKNFYKIKYNICNNHYFKLNVFLKKLKIYFPNDLSQEYFKFLTTLLSDAQKLSYIDIHFAVFGIFQLATATYKSEFMAKYAPTEGKIDHVNIDRKLLRTQEAICRFAGYSRPAIPLAEMLKYIKGDYVHYCLPIFNMYRANLPLTALFKFVETLLESAVSVQKHALRLAFHCFNAEDLRSLILKIWKRTKNISLRMVIYTSLLQDVVDKYQDEASQAEMFELLLTLTLDLNKDDHEDVINILTSCYRIPEKFRGSYLETSWKTVSKFPTEGSKNIEKRVLVLRNLKTNIDIIDEKMIREIIDDYFHTNLRKQHIEHSKGEDTFESENNSRQLFSNLNQAKFDLAVTFITKCKDEEDYRVEYVYLVLYKCFVFWNETYEDSYIFRDYCQRFIYNLVDQHFEFGRPVNTAMYPVFENILHRLQATLPFHEIYIISWNLRLTIIINRILDNHVKQECPRDLERELARNYAMELNSIVTEYVEKKIFFWSMLDEIVREIKHKMHKMTDTLASYPGVGSLLNRNVEAQTVLELSKINPNRIETAVLAVKLIPSYRSPLRDMNEVLADIYKNLKKFDNPEVQTFLYKQFINNGFKNTVI